MLNDKRTEHYLTVTRKRKLRKSQKAKLREMLSYTRTRSELTPAQEQRMRHKEGNRKTHEHDRSSVPDGKKFRCLRCMPLPAVKVPVKAAAGPRDWAPPNADLH